MAKQHAPARLTTQSGLRGVQLGDTDHGLEQTGVHAVDVEPRRQERNPVMGVRQAPAVAVERVIDLRLRASQEVLPIVIAQNHPEILVVTDSVDGLKWG